MTGDCHQHDDAVGSGFLPPGVGNNIGIMYFRNSALLLRCTFNWLYLMTEEARISDKSWDQTTFATAYESCSTWMRGGIKLVMLNSTRFPYRCMADCGERDDELLTI